MCVSNELLSYIIIIKQMTTHQRLAPSFVPLVFIYQTTTNEPSPCSNYVCVCVFHRARTRDCTCVTIRWSPMCV